MRTLSALVFASTLVAGLAACGDDSSDVPDGGRRGPDAHIVVPAIDAGKSDIDAATPTGTVHEVTLSGDRFHPGDLTIAVGDSVHWTNNESELHTVTSGTSPNASNAGDMFDQQMP